jgi:activator of 2-hydroxyglutaryl-CoA dehydratase
MNDKCAGGTGAVIDKINAKLRIPPDELCNQGYTGIKIHPVAGKCGVFAKCGHDAPIYSVVEQIVERSGTPYFSFKDLDENQPTNTIKLRVETIDYFLKRYREDLIRRKQKEREIERQLAEYEYDLREQFRRESEHLAHAS